MSAFNRLIGRTKALLGRVAQPDASWLSRPTPTADIYFVAAMEDLITRGDIVAVGPHVYRAGDRYVVLRYASSAEIEALEQASSRTVFYVIDDDLEALSRSGDLPASYRRRLAAVTGAILPRILALTDVVVAPSRLLLARFSEHEGELIRPTHLSVCEDFSHFDHPPRVRIVFTGTRSHLSDLAAVAAGLERLCNACPRVELTTFLGRWAPASLRRCVNVVNRSPLDWPGYREVLSSSRFHIAIAPFRPVATNQCRSHNKVHDHAAFGAAGLYGDILPYRQVIAHGQDGMLLPAEPNIWFEHLSRLVGNLAEARRLAEGGARLSHAIGDPAELRSFWLNKLGLRSSLGKTRS